MSKLGGHIPCPLLSSIPITVFFSYLTLLFYETPDGIDADHLQSEAEYFVGGKSPLADAKARTALNCVSD